MSDKQRQKQKNKKTPQSPSGFQARYYRGDTRAQTSRRTPWWRKIVLIVIIGSLLSGAWIFGRVEAISVTGVNDKKVVRTVHRQLNQHYTFLWHAYTKPVEETIRYPDNIDHVTLSADWMNQRLVASIRKASPALLWKTEGDTFIVNKQGRAIRKAEDTGQTLPVIIDDSGLPVNTGEQIAPEDFVAFVSKVKSGELPITRLRIVDTTRELYADLEDGYYVRFDTTAPVKTQLENVQRAQKTAKRNGDTITEYIDVRLPYKAYYK